LAGGEDGERGGAKEEGEVAAVVIGSVGQEFEEAGDEGVASLDGQGVKGFVAGRGG